MSFKTVVVFVCLLLFVTYMTATRHQRVDAVTAAAMEEMEQDLAEQEKVLELIEGLSTEHTQKLVGYIMLHNDVNRDTAIMMITNSTVRELSYAVIITSGALE